MYNHDDGDPTPLEIHTRDSEWELVSFTKSKRQHNEQLKASLHVSRIGRGYRRGDRLPIPLADTTSLAIEGSPQTSHRHDSL